MSQRILEFLNMSDFNVCIEYIKGKITNKMNKGANWYNDVLKLIDIDICELFPKTSWNS